MGNIKENTLFSSFKNIIKKKAVSPLIATILLIVVSVAIISIVLSWGKGVVHEEISKTDEINTFKNSDASNFIFKSDVKGHGMTFTYSPPMNLKNKEVVINRFSIKGSEEIIPLKEEIILKDGLNYISEIDLSYFNINQKNIDLVLYTKEDEILNLSKVNLFNYKNPPCESGFNHKNEYVICFVEDFEFLKDNLDLNYFLKKDIDFFNFDDWINPPLNISSTTQNWNDDKGFIPIGDFDTNVFSGIFNGNNKSINNLYINSPLDENISFFISSSDSSKIYNLSLFDVNIIGQNNVSGLVVENNGVLENISVTGDIYAKIFCPPPSPPPSLPPICTGGNNSGGIIVNNQGEIKNSNFQGNIRGESNIGGLAGLNNNYIEKCYSKGNISGNQNIGGFVGHMANESASIKNSYSQMDISLFEKNVYLSTIPFFGGGFIGNLVSGVVENSYFNGSFSNYYNQYTSYAGYFAGFSNGNDQQNSDISDPIILNSYTVTEDLINWDIFDLGSGNIYGFNCNLDNLVCNIDFNVINSYWDANVSSNFEDDFGYFKTTEEMMQQETFVGWDFENIWQIEEGVSYPTLR